MHVKDAIEFYRRRPDVLYAEPNWIVDAQVVPNDPSFSSLWGLNNTGQSGGIPDADIDALEAWGTTTGGSDVVVAGGDTRGGEHPPAPAPDKLPKNQGG